jgi:hypothetical protein
MDFGLVRVTSLPAGTTQEGSLLGTPEYMNPEQVRAPERIDTRSDIYSLGVTLYETLTGEVPFPGTPHHVLQQLLDEEPRSPRRLNGAIPRDLEIICLKCLQKDPGKRYPDAPALAEDLRRFLAGESIQARPVAAWERGVKWARRRPAIAALLAMVILVTAGGFAGVTWQWRKTEAARSDLETSLYFNRIALAAQEMSANQVGRAEELLDKCPTHLRGWEWHYLKRLRYGGLDPLQHTFVARGVTFSPDGQHVAAGADDGTVKIWDATTQKVLRTLQGHTGRVKCLAYSPDGQHLATASTDGVIII